MNFNNITEYYESDPLSMTCLALFLIYRTHVKIVCSLFLIVSSEPHQQHMTPPLNSVSPHQGSRV